MTTTTIIISVVVLIIGVLLTLLICYFLPKEKIKTANRELEKQEQDAKLRIQSLENDYLIKEKELNNHFNQVAAELSERNSNLIQTNNDLSLEVKGLEEKRNTIISTLEQEAKQSGEIFKNQQLEIAENQIQIATQQMQDEYKKATEDAKQTYLDTLADAVAEFNQQYGYTIKQVEEALQQLAEARSKADAAVEVNKRAELEREEKDFYRLQLSDIDKEEIQRLRSVEPYLRNKEPLNKVIWKVYYEKPYTDLIGRVVGTGRKTGIYKITNIENQMCYIGQAVDIAERWKQHIKRGIGAEAPTRNKLYPAMLSIGVENFTFEIIELCAGKDLNSREDYWQDFYHAKDFGYSIK